jgi:DtxR family Mn-dependent transcriptional regulator
VNIARDAREDYIKAIYLIAKRKKGGWVSNSEVSKLLEVKPASVSSMLHKLKEEGFVDWKPHRSIRLTNEGKKRAERVLKNYKALKYFFINTLNIKPTENLEKMCCKIEHFLTSQISEALYELQG